MERCEDVRKKLVHLKIGLLSPEEKKDVEKHVGDCAACRKALQALEADLASFRAWKDEPAPADILDAVAEQARRAASSRTAPAPGPEASPEAPPASVASRRPSQGVDIGDLLGDDSLESLEKDLQDLENLVATKRKPGTGTDVDLASADLYGKKKKAGKLSEDDREKLLQELGLDEDTPQEEEGGEEDGKSPALEDMAKMADQAAKRKSRRIRTGDEDWEQLCGTTVFDKSELPPVQGVKEKTEKKEAPPKAEEETRSTDEWLSLSGTGAVPPKGGSKSEADTLFGTTILPAAGGTKTPSKRFSSRMLAEIKLEDNEKRERKRKARTAGVKSFPVLVAVGLHLVVGLAMGAVVFKSLKRGETQPIPVTLDKDEIEKDRLIKEEKEQETDTPDPTKDDVDESAEETDDVVPDNQRVDQGKRIQIDKEDAPPEYRQKGNVDIVRRQRGTVGGGGRWKAVERGLDWLKRHQDESGRWDWAGYTRHCRPGLCHCPSGIDPENFGVDPAVAERDPSVLSRKRNYSIGLTGLALLCYLGSGYTHLPVPGDIQERVSKVYLEKHAFYRPTVEKAVRFLQRMQGPDGCFTPRDRLDINHEGYMYNQGICTLAILEACQMTQDRDPSLEDTAQQAVDFICRAQAPNGGWDYVSYDRYRCEYGRDTRTDVSVSSWQIMALKSALDAGLKVSGRVWRRADDYFRRMTLMRTGHSRYAEGREGEKNGEVLREHLDRISVGVTAASLLSKLYLGAPLKRGDIENGARQLMLELPDPARIRTPAPPGQAHNYHTVYYWYYGTLVMFHLGGEYWNMWKERLVEMLKHTQNDGTDPDKPQAKGSWDPEGAFLGRYAGRLYVTVFNILNLEVFYRYLPLYRTRTASAPEEKEEKKTLEDLAKTINRNKKKRGSALLQAVREVSRRYTQNADGVRLLARVMLDPGFGWRARQTAFMGLKKAGEPALPYLRRAFLQVDDNLKQMIMIAFVRHKDVEAAPLLKIVAEGREYASGVRKAASEALEALQAR